MQTPSSKLRLACALSLALVVSVIQASALTVKSVGSIQKGTNGPTEIAVIFSDPVESASGGNTANYTLGSGAVTSATLVTGLPAANLLGVDGYTPPSGREFDGMVVILTATGVTKGAANSLTVQNVKDTGIPQSTLTTTNINFTDSGYNWVETGLLGTSALPGHVFPIGTNGFDIFSSGATQWANYDEVTYAYKTVTGDFDYKARLEFQDVSSQWARAGIMLREDLDIGEPNPPDDQNGTFGRYVDMHANPVISFNPNPPPPTLINGNNGFESHLRDGQLQSGTANGTTSVGAGTPLYPNAWLRIQRVGDVVTTYRGDDGDNWTEQVVRTFGDSVDNPSLPATMYLGAGFSPETGNINPAEGKNRLFLAQIRFTKVLTPILRSFTSFPSGFRFLIDDSTAASTDTNTIVLKLNGATVLPKLSKTNVTTTIAYISPTVFAPGSTNKVDLTFKDSAGVSQTLSRTFVVGNYAVIPASYAASAPDLSKPGFKVFTHQLPVGRGPGDPNSIANAEKELANGFIDPGTGAPYANIAQAGTNPDGTFSDTDFINWQITGSDAGAAENFGAFNGYSNELVPGIDPAGSGTDNFVTEITTYLDLKAGVYEFGVNSDDGFRLTSAKGIGDVFGLPLGSFNGGRGSADTIFDFVVAADGVYPFRLAFWQGAGGGDIEFFLVDLASGQKALINEAANPASIKAYQAASSGAYIDSVLPVNGQIEVSATNNITAILVDGASSTVVNGSISMTLDGAAVVPTVTKVGTTNTVFYNPPSDFVPGSTHTVSLTYTDSASPSTPRTVSWSFTVTYFGPGLFAIEAEHFDFNGGQHMAAVDTMPYTGDEYNGQGALHDIDYHANDTGPFNADGSPSSNQYRTGIVAAQGGPARYVPMDSQTDAGTLDVQRGTFDVTTNYKIGWADVNEWYNYTRNIPSGVYLPVASLSHGDITATMRGTLSLVTAGVGTSNQTVVQLGTFTAPATGGWGTDALIPMKDASGSNAVIKLNGLTTLRFTTASGDYDWFMLVPVAGYPPRVLTASPANGSSAKPTTELNFAISDLSTAVVPGSIRLFLDNVDVTSGATITDTSDGATVRYVPPSPFVKETTHTYSLVFTDNGAPPVTQTNTGTFRVNIFGANIFVIEAEDFNYGGGLSFAAASTMPYTGGAYNNVGASNGVDYVNFDGNDSDLYRKGETPNVNMDPTGDTDRGSFSLTTNYKIGWVGLGDWQNYTRTFPTNNYEVFAGLSHGDITATMRGRLQEVIGSASVPNQSVQDLGIFTAPATGAWGSNAQVPLTETDGSRVVVHLGGQDTLKFLGDSGDFDYIVLVPTTAAETVPPFINSITLDGSGNIHVSWTRGGVLESTTDIANGPWTQVAATSPYSAPATGTARFFRARR